MKTLILTLITAILILGSCNKSKTTIEPEPQYKLFSGKINIMASDSGVYTYSYYVNNSENRIYNGNIGADGSFNAVYHDSIQYKTTSYFNNKVLTNDNMIFQLYYKISFNSTILIDTVINYQFNEGYNIVNLKY